VDSVWLNCLLILAFVIIGGFFAAAEIALVSLRDGQIKSLAGRGRRGETVARVAADPNRFLSAVQIGVTLMGFLSAAFGGATLASDLSPVLRDVGVSTALADVLALVLITVVISYVSIVLGELVAKRLALQRAEGTALLLAPSVDRIASAARPVIWLLSISTNAVVRLLGGDPGAQREQMSDEELRELVSTHETLTEEERRIVEDVFEAGDRQIREVMIPRTEVDFIDASMPVFKAMAFVAERPHSRYPVIRGSADDVIGFLHVRDLYAPSVNSRSARVGQLARSSLMLPGTREVLPTLADMRREGVHLAIVVDEYGGTDGIVTLEDLVEELVGDIRDEYDADESVTQRLVDGEVELDGLLNLDDFEEETGLRLPDGPYETVAGYITSQLGRLPAVGDECRVDGHLLSVIEMDGRRIDRVRVVKMPAGTFPGDEADPDGSSTDHAAPEQSPGSQPLNHPVPPPHV
jgi:putative hemolysin